ncbi:ATP-dependent helicase [Mycolicibacterium septicum]|nr:ATP-dependent helicase [Mycolicibacterium septicum]
MTALSPDSWELNGIDDLEPEAWKALRHSACTCVTAGPGAGKTEFLAQRAGYLLETGLCASPQRILAISFKRDAAFNLGDRVRERFPRHAGRFVSMTFDSFTKSIVDQFGQLLPGQWKMKNPYVIQYATDRQISDFLDRIAVDAPARLSAKLGGLSRKTFLTATLGSYALPTVFPAAVTATDYAVQQWWQRSYLDADVPRVEFVMLNRLAELIIRSGHPVRRALRVTYPFVFVDEFQDTTYAQYAFLRNVFGSSTVVTAVGDRKQRIMGWAGALNDAFAEFESDFDAAPFRLTRNFRSSKDLVDLQHRFAQLLDSSVETAAAQAVSDVEGHQAQIWSFPNAALEAQAVAAFIAADITASGRPRGQYALLARQKVADLEPALAGALSHHGISVRNDDAMCAQMRLQDLLKDPYGRLLIGLLRLSAPDRCRGATAQTWLDVSAAIALLRYGDNVDDHRLAQLDDAIAVRTRLIRAWLQNNPCSAQVVSAVHELLSATLHDLTGGRQRNLADTDDDLEVKSAAFQARLAEVAHGRSSWWDAAETYESANSVPLLTIHRSKGLEYHTVFFLGLDNAQWWSHRRETTASTATFFVGLSRAAHRVIFTQCDHRGGQADIADLCSILTEAGVPTRRFSTAPTGAKGGG